MNEDDEKRARSVGEREMMHNDDDMPSEDEQEIHDEVNPEMDGNIKIAKDVRGYDDANDQPDESNDES